MVSGKIQFLIKQISTIFLLIWSLNATAGNDDAVAIIEELHSTLIEVMKNGDSLEFQGRYDQLAPIIQSRFDTPLIAQVILSRYWKELNEEQQKNFIQLFNKLSISTYAARFNSYSGETFKTLGVEELKKGRLLVKTEFIKSDDKPVKFDYMVHQIEGNWYIISVIANGINDVALKRAEYATIISDRGFDSLLVDLETKIQELGNPPADN